MIKNRNKFEALILHQFFEFTLPSVASTANHMFIMQAINYQGESGLFLTHVLTLWGSSHIDRHIWRWVIVSSDLAWTFGAICAHYRYCGIHSTITYMRVWFKSTRERQLMLNETAMAGLATKKMQRYNNSPPYMMAKWLPQQIPPFNFTTSLKVYGNVLNQIKQIFPFFLFLFFCFSYLSHLK